MKNCFPEKLQLDVPIINICVKDHLHSVSEKLPKLCSHSKLHKSSKENRHTNLHQGLIKWLHTPILTLYNLGVYVLLTLLHFPSPSEGWLSLTSKTYLVLPCSLGSRHSPLLADLLMHSTLSCSAALVWMSTRLISTLTLALCSNVQFRSLPISLCAN